MKLNTLTAMLIAGTLSFGFSTDALAKKGGDKGGEAAEQSAEALPGGIVKTNVAFIDGIFVPVSEIFGILNGIETTIADSKTRILTALGAGADADFGEAFKGWVAANKKAIKPDIDIAAGKVDFSFAEDAGAEVKAAGEEIRGSITAITQSLAKLKDLGAKVQEVVAAAKGAKEGAQAEVQKLKSSKDVKGAMALGKAVPKIPKNLQATLKLPEAVKGATQAARDILKTIGSSFGGE